MTVIANSVKVNKTIAGYISAWNNMMAGHQDNTLLHFGNETSSSANDSPVQDSMVVMRQTGSRNKEMTYCD